MDLESISGGKCPGDSGERTGLDCVGKDSWLIEGQVRGCLVLKAKEVRLFWGNGAPVPLHLLFSSLHHFVHLSSTVMFPTFLFMDITSESSRVSMAVAFLR